LAVKVGNELPGPQRMMACRPGDAVVTAWGMVSRPCSGGFWGGSVSVVDAMGAS